MFSTQNASLLIMNVNKSIDEKRTNSMRKWVEGGGGVNVNNGTPTLYPCSQSPCNKTVDPDLHGDSFNFYPGSGSRRGKL